MKILRKYLLILLFLLYAALVTVGAELSSQIELHTFMEQESVPLNREVVYHVELTWAGDLSRYNIVQAGEPVVSNLTLRGTGSSNRFYTTAEGEQRSVKRITYYFKPIEMGMAYIDGVTIQYEDRQTSLKESLFAQRLGVKIIEPVNDDSGRAFGKWILAGITILFGFVVLFFVLRYFQQRRLQNVPEELPQQLIEDKYIEQLKTIGRMQPNKSRDVMSALQRTLQNYFTEKYQTSTSNGFDAIRDILRAKQIDETIIGKLQKFFEHAELSKFAGDTVGGNELHMHLDTVELLLRKLSEVPGPGK